MKMLTPLHAAVAAIAACLLLGGCVAKQPAADPSVATTEAVLTVTATADACQVSANTTTSGKATFRITNTAARTAEFYLLGADGLRIVAEKEDIAPGASADLTLTLQPGNYYTACKPGGVRIGMAKFTVTG